MVGKETGVARVTRAALKRARASEADAVAKPPEVLAPSNSKRKRVVLGELPHLANSLALHDDYPHNDSSNKPTKHHHHHHHKKKKPPPTNAAFVSDIDSGFDDPQMFAPYASDIHRYLRSMETERWRRPLPNYVEAVQRDVTPAMRAILVDWLVEVAEEYKLVSDTLYLTVSYIDRFLSGFSIDRKKLQLLGVSSMLIASKYEEISPPHVEDFCYITDNTYTKEEVVKMETDILKLLNFEMGNPTTKTFLRRYMRAGQDNCDSPNLQLELLGSFLAELSLLDYGCVRFCPSVIAASVVFLARFTVYPGACPWTSNLQHYTGYDASELKECVNSIHELHLSKKCPNLRAIRDKYKHGMFKCVANLPSPSEIPATYFEGVALSKV